MASAPPAGMAACLSGPGLVEAIVERVLWLAQMTGKDERAAAHMLAVDLRERGYALAVVRADG